MKLKPKALDLAYEGNILYIRNKTNQWRNKLTPEELDKVLEFAKKSKCKQKASYLRNKKLIFERKIKKLKESKKRRKRKWMLRKGKGYLGSWMIFGDHEI